ncbi:hypothetical protein [Deinococcus saxicola]|uniref:hypothetical protein n=1 Tax=Deinococcus saxicola TaxID=249406 RepID=UPI0039F1380F
MTEPETYRHRFPMTIILHAVWLWPGQGRELAGPDADGGAGRTLKLAAALEVCP